MSIDSPESFDEWCANLRKRTDKDVIAFRDMRGGGVRQQAGDTVWREREEAKQKKIRDEEFQRLKNLKQEREAEHTLWAYWRLANWPERFGMLCAFGSVFMAGYLSSKVDLISKFIDLIRSITP